MCYQAAALVEEGVQPCNCTYRDVKSSSNSEKRLSMIASIIEGLHWRLMSLLDNHHTSSLTYRPCCNSLNQGKTPFNGRFSILNNEKTVQMSGNVSSSQLKVAIQTHPHREKHCIISWWLTRCPPWAPSATNDMNCLCIASKWRHWNCYCVVPNVFCIVGMTGILTVIDIVCEVTKSIAIPSNVIV